VLSDYETTASTVQIPDILVLQDESDIRELIRENLAHEEMRISEVSEVETAMEKIWEHVPDLLILSMMRPKLSALQLCRCIRSDEHTRHVPILIVSAEAGSADKVLGLEVGADDYLSEPFNGDELIARVKALLRRSQTSAERRVRLVYQYGRLRIDLATRQVFTDGKERYLALKQFELLAFFARNPHQVFSRQQLALHIWGNNVVDLGAVKVAVRRLRKEVEQSDRKPTLIVTVPHVGYRFDPDG
jgi:DNA-binding response OmpR family regulator